MSMVYFDHNAASPLHPAARDAWLETAGAFIGNPSSPHRLGDRAGRRLEEARERLAERLGCRAADLVWTSGATEANNLALHHAARTSSPDAEVWVPAIEHPSVIEATRHHFRGRHRWIPVDAGGSVDLDWLAGRLARSRPALVGVMAANNVTGVRQPWREALALCRSFEVPFLTDAVQWLGREMADGLGAADLVSGCAHKVGGPRGIGFLKCPSVGAVQPLLLGGPQEHGRRSGTENVAGAWALSVLLEHREAQMAAGGTAAREGWRDHFEERLLEALPDARILGAGRARLWNTSAVRMPEVECPHRLIVKLDRAGFAVSMGSACSSGREKASPVLTAMGLPPEHASRVLRISGGWETTEAEWLAVAEAIVEAWRSLHTAPLPKALA